MGWDNNFLNLLKTEFNERNEKYAITAAILITKVYKKKRQGALQTKDIHPLSLTLCGNWKKDRMVNAPHSALPVPMPKTMENNYGQTPES